METHRNLLRGAFSLAVFLGLLTMYGCAGGWEGSIRVAPSIMRQPSSQSVAAGLTATFTVTATGTGPLSFQWFKGGIAISGANLSSYTTPVTAMSDNGAVFTVAVWNAVGRVTSVPAGLTVTSATLQSIAVTPASPSIAKGLTQQFNATGTYSDGSTQNITTSVTWASATTSVATIGAGTGLATGASVGTSQITATQGSTVSPPATLTVTSATLQSIAVTPASPSIPKGLTQQFNATGTYSDGSTQNITTSVTWASATTSVATIGAGTGLATGASVGTSQITATQGSTVSPPATLTVTSATLQSISVTPASPSIAKGLTQQFNATGTYSDGSTQNITTSVTWASATTSVATIGAGTGLATGASVGTSQITATLGTIASLPDTLTVTAAALQSISVTPASPSIAKGLTQQFNATGTYSDGSTQNITTSVTWASATTSVATIGAGTGLATGASVGTSQITATLGTIVSLPDTLTVTAAALQSISVTPANPSITVGETQQFVATGTYSDTSTQNITTSVTWASATTSVATIGASTGLATGVAAGTSQITAAQGTVVSLPDTLTVNNTTPLASSLTCTPTNPPYNSTVTLVPTFSGGTGEIGSTGLASTDITAAAISGNSYTTPPVTSAMTYTLTVVGSGGLLALSYPRPMGAAGGGNVASTTCSVTPTSVTISSISPALQTIAPGQQAFTASVSGGATNNVTWSANGGSFNGNIWTSPTTPGNYTITATSVDEPSVSLSTTITISLPVITTQPVSQNACTGGSISLSVTANYAASYQWKLGGVLITGANSASYNVSSASSGDAGSYTVTVTNSAGSVTSNAAQVLVGSTITSNPQSLSIYATQTATFSVSAAGDSPFSYQWYEIPSGGTIGSVISGAVSSSYTTPAVDSSYNATQYYAEVSDSCGSALDSTKATLTVLTGNVPPTITIQPSGVSVAEGDTASFTVVASGTPTLTYQWYRIPAGSLTGTLISGATSASYTVPASATTTSNDQDAYYVIVSNSYGQAVSQHAPLAVGSGILLQITGQPATVYVNAGAPASFTVTASSTLPLTYQWYEAAPGSSTFTAISGATDATYTLDSTVSTETGSVFKVVVSNGTTSSVTSSSASLFVGTLSGVNDLCDTNWTALANAVAQSGCSFQLTAAAMSQHGEIVWPTLISTGNIQLSFTVAISNPSTPPADGFAMVLGDPSLGATPTSTGAVGEGLGARGIPGFVLGFDTYWNAADPINGYPADPPVPYLGVGRGESALWENPWFNVNTNIPALATHGTTVSHNYAVSIVQGQMTVTMDGTQVFSGSVTVPPVAYLYVTASTGGDWEKTVISNLSATVSAPSN